MKNAEIYEYGSNTIDYCLAKEGDEAVRQRNELIADKAAMGFHTWSIERSIEVKMRRMVRHLWICLLTGDHLRYRQGMN